MDLLVYIRDGENEELRYAIRSWCENLKFDKLVAVTGEHPPKWFEPDEKIVLPVTKEKTRQAYNNILAGIQSKKLSDNFLLMMDDIFILYDIGQWQKGFNFNRGDLDTQLLTTPPTTYEISVAHTKQKLIEKKLTTLSFEEHAPFYCNKKKMENIFKTYGEDIYGLLIRSLYGNTYNIDTDYKPDFKAMKVDTPVPNGEVFISTTDASFKFGAAGSVIRKSFTTKSRYES